MGDFIWKKTMGANYRTHNQLSGVPEIPQKNRGIQILTQHLFPQLGIPNIKGGTVGHMNCGDIPLHRLEK
jgi:hypothetical protein